MHRVSNLLVYKYMNNQTNGLEISKNLFLSPDDRSRNILVTGIPGVGVSRYLLNLINQDIHSSRPIIIFDQYGDLAEEIIASADNEILPKIAYLDLGNNDFPIGLNLFEEKDEKNRQQIANTLISLMYDLYDPKHTGVIGPRFEHAVRNAILTIMYDENASFVELLRCLTDATYLKNILPKVQDPIVLNYWNKQVAQTSDFHKSEVLDYIVSKLGLFVTDKSMRYILGQSKSTFSFLSLFSNYQIILFDFKNLRRYGDANKIITTILLFKLVNYLEHSAGNPIVNLYIDEASAWPTTFICDLLMENRRYGLNLTLTTNKTSEVSLPLKRALSRVGTLVSFRQTTEEAKVIVPEFHSQQITVDKLCLLKKYQAYLKTLQDGNVVIKEEPVNFEQNLPENKIDKVKVGEFKNQSQKKFGIDRQTVESDLQKRMG